MSKISVRPERFIRLSFALLYSDAPRYRSENLDQVSVKALNLITEEQDTCVEERTSMPVPVFQTKATGYSLQVDKKLYSHVLTFKSSFTSRNKAQILLQSADFLGYMNHYFREHQPGNVSLKFATAGNKNPRVTKSYRS